MIVDVVWASAITFLVFSGALQVTGKPHAAASFASAVFLVAIKVAPLLR